MDSIRFGRHGFLWLLVERYGRAFRVVLFSHEIVRYRGYETGYGFGNERIPDENGFMLGNHHGTASAAAGSAYLHALCRADYHYAG